MNAVLRSALIFAGLLASFDARAAMVARSAWVPLKTLKAKAHHAGLQAIADVWAGYLTSTTKETYADFYGRSWDRMNGKKVAANPTTDETKKKTVAQPRRLAALTKTLSLTRAGTEALDIMRRYRVRVVFIQDSKAGYYRSSTNTVAIGDQRADAENTLLHELNHALTFHTGKVLDARTTSRKAWVKDAIADEARSDGLVAVAGREFARLNRAATSGVRVAVGTKRTTPIYLDAYKKVIAEGRAARLRAR